MSGAELDPGACWVRHIKRGVSTELGAVEVLGGRYFTPQPREGVNGRQGWQSAQIELRMNDDGSGTARFPNAAGEDGQLHRRRFAIGNEPLYRPGEEWLEFYREPLDILFVGTPAKRKLDRSELVLECLDGMVLLANSRASEADVWIGAAPLEVLEHYLGAQVERLTVDLRGWTGAGDPRTTDWILAGAPAAATAGDGIALADALGGAEGTQSLTYDLPAGLTGRDFILEVRVRHTVNAGPSGRVRTTIAQNTFAPQHSSAGVISGMRVGSLELAKLSYTVPGVAVHRLIARGEWLYCYVNGELIAHGRRDPAVELDRILIDTVDATAVVQSVRLITHEPLLGRDGCDRRLPGIPPPGGLRGRYYRESTARALPTPAPRTLSPLAEPYTERLDAGVDFAPATPPAWQPPGPPSGNDFSARWTGAIYLDLAASDRRIRLVTGANSGARLYVAGILVLDRFTAYDAVGGTFDSGLLRALLGETEAGWYPIRLETYIGNAGTRGIRLHDGAADGAGAVAAYAAVPASRLSPIGTVDHEARHQSHREIIGEISDTFGYQWTLEPRSLESGLFPGQVCPRVRLGYDTALVIRGVERLPNEDSTEEAAEVVSEVDAGDCADALIVDASGLASLEDGAQLSHEAFLTGADHVVYSQAYESLAEISEETLLRTRTESLLALRSSPNEVIGVRPQGRRDLVDRFPLPDEPELARMLWTPGLGVRLALEEIDVVDRTPRQLTAITWPLIPDGAAPPIVGFRQRPRGLRAALERTRRAALAPQRHYQGQHVVIPGTLGALPTSAGLPDSFTRLALPDDLERVSALLFVVLAKTGVTAHALELNSVATGLSFTDPPAPVDVKRFLAKADATLQTSVIARLTGVASGTTIYQLQAVVRI